MNLKVLNYANIAQIPLLDTFLCFVDILDSAIPSYVGGSRWYGETASHSNCLW